MNIGKAIKELRGDICLSQKDYASRIGVTQSYLSQIENGQKKPSMELIEVISEDLGKPLAILLWFSLDESDVSDEKVEVFKVIKPSIDQLIKLLYI